MLSFSAVSSAWVKATENGYDSLIGVVNTCEEILEPTLNPTGITVEPTFKIQLESVLISTASKT